MNYLSVMRIDNIREEIIMDIPKVILAACDDSSQATHVAAYAADLAVATGRHLILSRVIQGRNVEAVRQALSHFPYGFGDLNEAVSSYVREEKKNAHQELGLLLSGRRHPNLKIETLVRVGVPHEVLLALIEKKKVDMVVVGASKHHLLSDRILGSTVNHLFRRCPVPLVSARQSIPLATVQQIKR